MQTPKFCDTDVKIKELLYNIRKLHTGDSWGKLSHFFGQIQHSGMMTFLHLNIYAWVNSTTPKSAKKSIKIDSNIQV